jgi:REP element-mobilizing transposase RayT
VSARSNHIHLAVTADQRPELVRDQFKANATRVLRQNPEAMSNEKIWTRGGDCEIIDGDDSFSRVLRYIIEAQARMDREK